MISTATLSSTNYKPGKISRTSSILLTPTKDSKRRKVDGEQPASTSAQTSLTRKPEAGDSSAGATATSSPAEIWRWTMTKDAVAPCFVQDVFDMRHSGHKDAEYFWLGRVPCRTVCLVGVLVGVQPFESRIVYTLDDGSAVVDCNHKQPPQVLSPRKRNILPARKSGHSRQSFTSTSSSHAYPHKGSHVRTAKPLPFASLPLPEPISEVGTPVRVVGRVVETSKGRQVLVDEIRPCSSPNDEPTHWLAVLELHRTRYAEDLGPFVIPPQKMRPQPPWVPGSPDKGKAKVVHEPLSPTKTGSVNPDPQTPSSSDLASSPGSHMSSSSRHSDKKSAPRLRHPTRLHRRDLTANAFRIYLKHYMDHAPPPSSFDTPCSSRPASPTPLARTLPQNAPQLPTHTTEDEGSLRTPRRPRGSGHAADRTPRPSQLHARLGQIGEERDRTPRAGRAQRRGLQDGDEGEERYPTYGFTLSHLRRVPELATLARRVVDEEGRRRAKEDRQKEKTASVQGNSKAKARSAPARERERSFEPKTKKMKRLFQFAIRQLYDEGSIVLWDGPVRPLPTPSLLSQLSQLSGPLWKANSSGASASAVSAFSTATSVVAEDDPGELSDPSLGEEAYIPLTPVTLASTAERAIKDMIAAAAAKRQKHRRARADVDPSAPLAPLAPPPGPTPTEIVAWLHRDARWARVGEWAVKEALEWARAEGRVWCIGHGRWEVCG